eukprot:jgi/Botrbrau1/21961/Bobra.0249s0084.1
MVPKATLGRTTPAIPKPFSVEVTDDALADLRSRLASTRWPPDQPESAWKYGVNSNYIKDLADYWQNKFSWRDSEKKINAVRQFTLPVNGIDLHFSHSISERPNAIPLLYVHGWPGSYLEVLKLLPLLTGEGRQSQLEQYFHVVAPSLPGFGFSSAPARPKFGLQEIAKTLDSLMLQLGYSSYVAHGTDWGAMVIKVLAAKHSASCRAVHGPAMVVPKFSNPRHLAQLANMVVPGLSKRPLFLTAVEMKGLRTTLNYLLRGCGYFLQQGTNPQTLGYGLTDSPVGLLAWIVDKYYRWTDCKGDLDSVISRDELLTIVSLYWFTNSMNSSMRLYYEFFNTDGMLKMLTLKGKVPMGGIVFPKDIILCPQAWAEAWLDVKQWSVFPDGGHFPALERPHILAHDMAKFFAVWH